MYERVIHILGELHGSSAQVLATIAVAGSKTYGDTVAVITTLPQAHVAWFEGSSRGNFSPYVAFAEEATRGVTSNNILLDEASCLVDMIERVVDDPQLVQTIADQFAQKLRELEEWNSYGCARRAAVTGRSQKMCPQGYIEWLRRHLMVLTLRGFNPRGGLIEDVNMGANSALRLFEAKAVEAAVKAAEAAAAERPLPKRPRPKA